MALNRYIVLHEKSVKIWLLVLLLALSGVLWGLCTARDTIPVCRWCWIGWRMSVSLSLLFFDGLSVVTTLKWYHCHVTVRIVADEWLAREDIT